MDSRTARLALLLVLLAGCSTSVSTPPPGPPSPATEATGAAWSLDDARVDRVPARPGPGRSTLPRRFPVDDAVLPSVLDDPPGRARLAYSPRESFDDIGGWATERVLLLGVDGDWRSLALVDLGLPEDAWQGVDTYGAGYLSPDGRTWLGRHKRGVVLLDLGNGTARSVALPGSHTAYAAWHPSSRTVAAVRLSGRRTYRTWSVEPAAGAAREVPWASTTSFRLPIDGYATDGSVVTFRRRGTTTERVVHDADRVVSEAVPVPYRIVRNGGVVGVDHTLLGLRRSLLVVTSDALEPVARLALGRRGATSWPRGWLDDDTVYVAESRLGLLSWDVRTGEVRTLVRPHGAHTPDAWWSASVAEDLLRR